MKNGSTTRNAKIIATSPEVLYKALTTPEALEAWLAPGEMTGKMHHFDLRIGGGFQMSLFYPESEENSRGKTTAKEDRFKATFIELVPNRKVVEVVTFESSDSSFRGEMKMEVTLEPKGNSTEITFLFTNIPPGIDPKDNEKGTELTLDKLERFVTQESGQ